MPSAIRRGVWTSEFLALSIFALIAVAFAWRGVDPKHTTAAGIATATYAVARTALKLFAPLIERKCLVNLKAYIANALAGYIDKTIAASLSADEQVVVNNAVAALVDLGMLLVEKEGVKLFAAKNPQLATGILAVLNAPKAA